MKIVFAALLLSVLPLVSHADNLDIRTGAWEVTQSTAVAGMMIPEDTLASMPPAQRAKVAAAMRARAGKVNKTVMHTCVTKQDLDRNELLGKENANCKRTVITQNTRHLEIEETCTAPEPRTSRFKFDATSAEAYTGTIDVTQGGGGQVHVDMSGRWTASTCKKGDDD